MRWIGIDIYIDIGIGSDRDRDRHRPVLRHVVRTEPPHNTAGRGEAKQCNATQSKAMQSKGRHANHPRTNAGVQF
eukprot:jgi/Psemu1/313204/fgenesh1_kg.1124_\